MKYPQAARPTRLSFAAFAVTVLLALCAPATAIASYTFTDGAMVRFGGTLTRLTEHTASGYHSLTLERRTIWELKPGHGFDPQSAERLSNGNTLVADPGSGSVTEYRPNNTVAWSYDSSDDPDLAEPSSAQRLSNGNTLICDASGARVLEVTPSKAVVWRYGNGSGEVAPGTLSNPVHATRLANGNTLISDAGNGHRVIEVRSSDYDASAPSDGYSASSIVWRYGADGTGGTGAGQVDSPTRAQRLANGNTLITDSTGQRVIEVDSAGSVVWQFGEAQAAGSDLTHLSSPSSAQRLGNGDTTIADTGNSRVLRVSPSGTVVDYSTGENLASPGTALVTSRGSTLIADRGNNRLLEVGYASSGRYQTGDLDLGIPGVNKWLTLIVSDSSRPSGTSIAVKYSLNGGAWKSAGNGVNHVISSTSPASFVRFRVDIATNDLGVTPELRTLSATYYLAKPPVYKPGTGGTKKPTNGATGTTQAPAGYGGTSSDGNSTTTYGTTGSSSGSGSTGSSSASSLQALQPVGENVPISAASMMLSGWVMEQTIGETLGGGDGGDGSPTTDPAGLAAAALLLLVSYAAGMSSSPLAHAALAASRSAHALVTRSLNG